MGETKMGFMAELLCKIKSLSRLSHLSTPCSYSSNKLEFIQRVNIRCQLLKGGYNKQTKNEKVI